jgi:hypothetical protein
MRYPFALTLVLILVLLAALPSASGAEDDRRVFPTALGLGRVTASGRFVKTTILPREDLPRETMSPAHARFKVDLEGVISVRR